MNPPRLLAVTDRALMGPDPLETIQRLMTRLGPRLVVLVREPELSARELLAWGQALARSAEGTGSTVFLRDRADVVAQLAPRVGLYLPERGLPLADARALLGRSVAIGCSTHTPAAAVERAAQGADLLVLAPIFATPSKPATLEGSAPVVGLEGLREAVQGVAGRAPLFALGGVDAAQADSVVACGAAGPAAVRAAWTGGLADWLETRGGAPLSP